MGRSHIQSFDLSFFDLVTCASVAVWYGMWFDYILEMEEVMNSGEYNMHLIYYEDLKKVFTINIFK